MNTEHVPLLAIDGPSGSGKGTVSQIIARRLGWHYLDSGALYRVLALAAENHTLALDDAESLETLAEHLDVEFALGKDGQTVILLEGEPVTEQIRSEIVGNAASIVAALPGVRAALLARQRAFREMPGLVADGRDMGSTVFPDAPLKIFLTASAEARAERRYKQLKEKGMSVNLAPLLEDIERRDLRDSQRGASPMIAAEDAILLDTTELDIEAVVAKILELCQQRFDYEETPLSQDL
ncbi:(d)CMP kinase [Sulfuriflexus mobilis]|uniref:(d)CMP kinase n=1 Tax=Sulfuriflexus mobilis TaxID=1811807 RepID=UPI000F8476CF|nr:(d)CMP kinase [Sulfuriflexus mobilis]